jgi:dienelactone hydrolase
VDAVFYANRFSQQYTVLYGHGRAEQADQLTSRITNLSQVFVANVLAFEFPGYGSSQAQPTAEACNRAAFEAYQMLRKELKIPAHRIILLGWSLGTGPLVELAKRQSRYAMLHPAEMSQDASGMDHVHPEMPGALVLQSPFTSFFGGVPHFGCCLSRLCCCCNIFPNQNNIGKVHCPVLILHGKQDKVVPYSHALALAESHRNGRDRARNLMASSLEQEFGSDDSKMTGATGGTIYVNPNELRTTNFPIMGDRQSSRQFAPPPPAADAAAAAAAAQEASISSSESKMHKSGGRGGNGVAISDANVYDHRSRPFAHIFDGVEHQTGSYLDMSHPEVFATVKCFVSQLRSMELRSMQSRRHQSGW